ncbi:MAG TPA: C4-type zinc ribbon domain-containing protein [Candidatus Nanopelagicales bacterium]|nr:C4-type zinc ribbon domain-containing protein [Candidatus Nanopelagicales bacterium]
MNAEPEVQLRLLDLQAVDARLAQLAHRRRSLPELATIAELGARLAAIQDRIVAAQTECSDLDRAQHKADLDVEQVRTRSTKDQELLDSGRITSAKDLESLQHELASLARRQSELEDVELEVMERLEDARAALSDLTAERDRLQAELAVVEQSRDAAFADLDGDRSLAAAERDRLAPGIPAELATLYDKLRADHDGVGAAALRHGSCEGCRMQLTPVDLARIRSAAPDEVLRCEECRRILVRTPESGLA